MPINPRAFGPLPSSRATGLERLGRGGGVSTRTSRPPELGGDARAMRSMSRLPTFAPAPAETPQEAPKAAADLDFTQLPQGLDKLTAGPDRRAALDSWFDENLLNFNLAEGVSRKKFTPDQETAYYGALDRLMASQRQFSGDDPERPSPGSPDPSPSSPESASPQTQQAVQDALGLGSFNIDVPGIPGGVNTPGLVSLAMSVLGNLGISVPGAVTAANSALGYSLRGGTFSGPPGEMHQTNFNVPGELGEPGVTGMPGPAGAAGMPGPNPNNPVDVQIANALGFTVGPQGGFTTNFGENPGPADPGPAPSDPGGLSSDDYQHGGRIPQRGKRSDPVDVTAHEGEFVVDADSTKRFGPALERLNKWEPGRQGLERLHRKKGR